jgi:hypothetical protein
MKHNIVLLVLLAAACSDPGAESGVTSDTVSVEQAYSKLDASNKDFDVQFSECNVFAGLANVPAANARALVPAEYTLAGNAPNATMVVRVVHCNDVVVDGTSRGSTIISHIGIGIVGPDTTVNLNNYTLWYATDNAVLHAKLTAAGLDADMSNSLGIGLATNGTLSVVSSSSHTPSFRVDGTATLPTAAPVPTSATWWENGNHGAVSSKTVLPVIQFGTAHSVLTTPANSALAALIGGTSLTFAVLDSYNLFPAGTMEVRDTD